MHLEAKQVCDIAKFFRKVSMPKRSRNRQRKRFGIFLARRHAGARDRDNALRPCRAKGIWQRFERISDDRASRRRVHDPRPVHDPSRARASRHNTRRSTDAAKKADSSLRSRNSSDSSRSPDHRNSRRTMDSSRCQKRKLPALEPGARMQRAGRML